MPHLKEIIALLEERGGQGAVQHNVPPQTQRLLLLAARLGDETTVRECLEMGTSAKGSEKTASKSPIHLAAMAGSGEESVGVRGTLCLWLPAPFPSLGDVLIVLGQERFVNSYQRVWCQLDAARRGQMPPADKVIDLLLDKEGIAGPDGWAAKALNASVPGFAGTLQVPIVPVHTHRECSPHHHVPHSATLSTSRSSAAPLSRSLPFRTVQRRRPRAPLRPHPRRRHAAGEGHRADGRGRHVGLQGWRQQGGRGRRWGRQGPPLRGRGWGRPRRDSGEAEERQR